MTDATTQGSVLPVGIRQAPWRIAVVLSLLLILAAAGSALFIVRGYDEQLNDIARTYEVRRQTRELIYSLVSAETGQRGYVLTLDESYLAPYRQASIRLDDFYAGLTATVAGNPAQASQVAGWAELIAAKREEMEKTIELARAGRVADALAIVRSDSGRELMDTIRTRIESFIAAEDQQLVERNAGVEQPRQMLVIAILAALAGSATLAYVLFTRTQSQVQTLSRTGAALLAQNEELESHVRARTAELEEARAHAERERARVETLLQDTNHRIGNSLATVSSLLGLQLTRSPSDEVRAALEAAQGRVQAIASGHRRLRLGADLETTNAAEFLEAVTDDFRSTLIEGRPIEIVTDFEPLIINARDATTLGIVLGELVTNAIKHAFVENQPGTVWARLTMADGIALLTVEDNGRGLPPESGEGGLGATIIQQLARQFGGETSLAARPDGGTRVAVSMPKLDLHPEGN